MVRIKKGIDMGQLGIIAIFIASLFPNSCGSAPTAKAASDDIDISCKFLDSWDFKRCENEEVICYTNENGLSCKWK
jgi:hypothetical protein